MARLSNYRDRRRDSQAFRRGSLSESMRSSSTSCSGVGSGIGVGARCCTFTGDTMPSPWARRGHQLSSARRPLVPRRMACVLARRARAPLSVGAIRRGEHASPVLPAPRPARHDRQFVAGPHGAHDSRSRAGSETAHTFAVHAGRLLDVCEVLGILNVCRMFVVKRQLHRLYAHDALAYQEIDLIYSTTRNGIRRAPSGAGLG